MREDLDGKGALVVTLLRIKVQIDFDKKHNRDYYWQLREYSMAGKSKQFFYRERL